MQEQAHVHACSTAGAQCTCKAPGAGMRKRARVQHSGCADLHVMHLRPTGKPRDTTHVCEHAGNIPPTTKNGYCYRSHRFALFHPTIPRSDIPPARHFHNGRSRTVTWTSGPMLTQSGSLLSGSRVNTAARHVIRAARHDGRGCWVASSGRHACTDPVRARAVVSGVRG